MREPTIAPTVADSEGAHLYELQRRESAYWWHVNKRELVRLFLRHCAPPSGALLEVGCGAGLLPSLLAGEGWRVVVGDISPVAARFAREHGLKQSVVFDAGAAWPFRRDSFDALLMLDLLEHVEDAAQCLEEGRRVLRGGGVVVLTVPAHPCLFSAWDRAVGHKRRYSAGELCRAGRRAGLEPVRISHWNAVSFLPAVVLRGASRMLGSPLRKAEFPSVPRPVNAFLKWWGRLESRCILRGDLAVGLSLVAVFRKARNQDGA